MNRVWIAGSAGSGKTTLAIILGERLSIPVYHRDYITWNVDNDKMRCEDEQIALTKEITDNDKWIFDGARFTASKIDGRLDKCDTIIHLSINRFVCLYRAFKRSCLKSKKGDLRSIDKQQFTFELFKYILFDYPSKKHQRYKLFCLAKSKGINVIVFKKQKEVNEFISRINL